MKLQYLSPSSSEVLISCEARFVYEKAILPRIRNAYQEQVSQFGRIFHEAAESGFNEKDVELALYREDNTVDRDELESLSELVKRRPYYDLPYESEVEIEFNVRDKGVMRGYIDRVATDEENGKVYIIDYKTAAWPNLYKDTRQVKSYALGISKLRNIDPDNIVVILDYVRADYYQPIPMSKKGLELHENYLVMLFKRANDLLRKYADTKDIRQFTHTLGDCNFCPMKGKCIAYYLEYNPTFDPTQPDEMNTEDMIEEYLRRKEIASVNFDRADELRKALLVRLDHKGDELSPKSGMTHQEMIKDHFNRIESTQDDFPTQVIVDKALGKLIDEAVKADPFTNGLVDTQFLKERVGTLVAGVLPRSIPVKKVSREFKDHLDEKDIRTWKKRPYLTLKR